MWICHWVKHRGIFFLSRAIHSIVPLLHDLQIEHPPAMGKWFKARLPQYNAKLGLPLKVSYPQCTITDIIFMTEYYKNTIFLQVFFQPCSWSSDYIHGISPSVYPIILHVISPEMASYLGDAVYVYDCKSLPVDNRLIHNARSIFTWSIYVKTVIGHYSCFHCLQSALLLLLLLCQCSACCIVDASPWMPVILAALNDRPPLWQL